MLPSFYIPTFKLFGVIPIQPFGLLVVAAIVLGYVLGQRRAEKVGLDGQICGDGEVWIVATGFVVAHWVSVIFYFPDKLLDRPWVLLLFWEGLSSFGGLLGAMLGAVLFFRYKKVSIIKYCDAIIFGFVPAWIVGRAGCTIVFDHKGQTTDFFLGMVHHGDKLVRHNLGLYEMIFAVFLTIVIYALKNVRPFDGFHSAVMLLLYSPLRFYLDTLRISDKTYFGLTPGQYFAVGMVLFAIYLIVKGLKKKREGAEEPGTSAAGAT